VHTNTQPVILHDLSPHVIRGAHTLCAGPFTDDVLCENYCIRQFCVRSVDCRGPSSERLSAEERPAVAADEAQAEGDVGCGMRDAECEWIMHESESEERM
jgi:hypothetical protein